MQIQRDVKGSPISPCLTALCLCRCAVGDDWWYIGDRCQRKGSARDATVTAVGASMGVLAGMLVVTGVSVMCVRKKYKKQLSQRNPAIALEDVSIWS